MWDFLHRRFLSSNLCLEFLPRAKNWTEYSHKTILTAHSYDTKNEEGGGEGEILEYEMDGRQGVEGLEPSCSSGLRGTNKKTPNKPEFIGAG